MELKQIRYFLALAETFSFTEAAERNGVSQPALTRGIQRLEDEIGGALVHRDGKHTRLTELGRKLLTEFEAIRHSEERALQMASMHADSGDTHIRLGIANTLGPRPFAQLVSDFLGANPAVRITLHPVNAQNTEEQILSGMLDACLCANVHASNHKIRKTKLFEERLMAAMSERHPLASKPSIKLADMVEYPYYDRLNCEFRPAFIEEATGRSLDLRTVLQSEREDWIQQLVRTGDGMTSLAEHSSVVSGIAMRPIDDVEMARSISLISVLGSTGNTALREFEKMVEAYDWSSISANSG